MHLFDKRGQTDGGAKVAEGDGIDCEAWEVVDRVDQGVEVVFGGKLDSRGGKAVQPEQV